MRAQGGLASQPVALGPARMLSAAAKSVSAFARSGPMDVSDVVADCVLSVPEEEDCTAAAAEVAVEVRPFAAFCPWAHGEA
eukprot:6823085-Alexandrium_andersonii.AAC.1